MARILILGVSIALPLAAQAQPAPEPPKTLDVTFHVMQIGRAPVDGVRYSTGPAGSTPMAVKPHARTGPFRYRGPNPIVFFREEHAPDGRPVREALGTLSFATSLRQALVFAIPRAAGASTGDEVAFVAIDDSHAAFGPDSLLIYNALPVRVGALIAGQRFVVEPGAHPPVPVRDWHGKSVPIEFWIETSEGPRMVLGSEIDFGTDLREIMVLLPPRRPGSWLIQSVRITESLNTPPPPPPRATP